MKYQQTYRSRDRVDAIEWNSSAARAVRRLGVNRIAFRAVEEQRALLHDKPPALPHVGVLGALLLQVARHLHHSTSQSIRRQ